MSYADLRKQLAAMPAAAPCRWCAKSSIGICGLHRGQQLSQDAGGARQRPHQPLRLKDGKP